MFNVFFILVWVVFIDLIVFVKLFVNCLKVFVDFVMVVDNLLVKFFKELILLFWIDKLLLNFFCFFINFDMFWIFVVVNFFMFIKLDWIVFILFW